MAETDIWLSEFSARHSNVNNPGAFWASLTLVLVGTVGVLWSLPIPAAFANISPFLNWGSAFLMTSVIYYFIISLPLGFGMLPFVWGLGALQVWLSGQAIPLQYASAVLVGAGVTGLSLGRFSGGGLRAVSRDVQLLMIAPLWLLSNIYRRLKIPF